MVNTLVNSPGAIASIHLHDDLHGPGREIALGRKTTIGRDLANQIHLTCPHASRQHCQIVLSAGQHWLVDLDSSGGTWLNGERVARALLRDGDLIQLGTKVLRFVAPEGGRAPERESWLEEAAPPTWMIQAHRRPAEGDPNWIEAWLSEPGGIPCAARRQAALDRRAAAQQAEQRRISPSPATPRQALDRRAAAKQTEPRRISPSPAVPRVRARNPRTHVRVCPLCREDARSHACGRCLECQTIYHEACYAELGGCATLGCSRRGRSEVSAPVWNAETLRTVAKWAALVAVALIAGSLLWPISPAVATAIRVVIPAAAMGLAYGELKRRERPAFFEPTRVPA